MRVVTILFCSVFVSCVPLQVLFSGSAAAEEPPSYRELEVDYALSFEKRLSTDYTELDKLVDRTQLALDAGQLSQEQQVAVRRWRHKLRSYLSFVQLSKSGSVHAVDTAEPEVDGSALANTAEPAPGLSSLILNRLRNTDATSIDLEHSNDEFYQQVKDNQHGTEQVSTQAKKRFATALLSKVTELTAKSVRRYHRLFPFAQSNYASVCQEVATADCQHLRMQDSADVFEEQPFGNAAQLTDAVNETIVRLNEVITQLTRINATNEVFFIFKQTDFDNLAVQRLYHAYEWMLSNAARRGILPIMSTPTFRARAGNIYINNKGGLDLLQRLGLQKDKAYAAGEVKHELITEVSQTVVEQSLSEVQRATVTRWVELQEMHRKGKKFADKELYQWSIVNEIATAQVVLQEPLHGVVVTHLLNRYQYDNRDPLALRIIRGVSEMAELGVGVYIFGSMVMGMVCPPCVAAGLTSTAIVVATSVNFVWAGMAGLDTMVTQRRWLQLEYAMLTGNSERYEDNLQLLREFHRTRRNAIVAGAIGLPMSVPSIGYALNHMYDGSKVFLVDAVASVFSARNEFGYEGLSDTDVHTGH